MKRKIGVLVVCLMLFAALFPTNSFAANNYVYQIDEYTQAYIPSEFNTTGDGTYIYSTFGVSFGVKSLISNSEFGDLLQYLGYYTKDSTITCGNNTYQMGTKTDIEYVDVVFLTNSPTHTIVIVFSWLNGQGDSYSNFPR